MPSDHPPGSLERTAPASERDDAPVTAARDARPKRALFAEAVTIARPPADIYAFWRDPLNLAQLLDNVQSIAPLDSRRSTWTIKWPGSGQHYSWVSNITHDLPDREIAWQSEPGSDVDNSGKVEFRDAGSRGTVVRLAIAYDPPGGLIGRTIAKLIQREPHGQSRRALHRLKQLMETGEIATSARNRREQTERQGETA